MQSSGADEYSFMGCANDTSSGQLRIGISCGDVDDIIYRFVVVTSTASFLDVYNTEVHVVCFNKVFGTKSIKKCSCEQCSQQWHLTVCGLVS